jgi:hypothetical protein
MCFFATDENNRLVDIQVSRRLPELELVDEEEENQLVSTCSNVFCSNVVTYFC